MNCTLAISLKFTESGSRFFSAQPSPTWPKPPPGVGRERRQPHSRETGRARPGRRRSAMSEESGEGACASRTGARDFPLRILGPRVRTFLLLPRATASRRERVRTRRSSIDTNGFSRDILICEPACRHRGHADPYRPRPVRLIAVHPCRSTMEAANQRCRRITRSLSSRDSCSFAKPLAKALYVTKSSSAGSGERPDDRMPAH